MKLRATVEALSLKQTGRLPDLANPRGYNDKIHWLKLHDQRREQITACDKWAVRGMVPQEVLVPAALRADPDLVPGVVKATHDSGSAICVHDEVCAGRAFVTLSHTLNRPYGVAKGEWAYQFGNPQVMIEQMLEPNITDYKFHCINGQIRWVQVIGDRSKRMTRETIFDEHGAVLPLHMDEKMRHVPDASIFPGETAWSALTDLARHLAKPWRYVRVDLYWSRGRAWFGELTFWPRAGCYRSKDEPLFGDMLDIDLSVKLEPIVA